MSADKAHHDVVCQHRSKRHRGSHRMLNHRRKSIERLTIAPAPAPLAMEPTKARKGFARAASMAPCGEQMVVRGVVQNAGQQWEQWVSSIRLPSASGSARTQDEGRAAFRCPPAARCPSTASFSPPAFRIQFLPTKKTSEHDRVVSRGHRMRGIINLGNTCFISSVLQVRAWEHVLY